jgi:hypothetical protein
MRWIEFTETVQFESEGRGKGPTFVKGERHQVEDAFAERWLRRGVAKLVDGPPPKAKPKEETPPAEPRPVAEPMPVSAAEPKPAELKPTERAKPRHG